MVATIEISPPPPLTPFINYYLLREFDTQGYDLIRPWTATHEVYLTFFLKDKPVHLLNMETGYYVKGGPFMAVQGIATHYNGVMLFNGCYSILNICFKPHGFYKIFNIPLNEFTNKIFDTLDHFSIPAKHLYEQLVNAHNAHEMASFVNAFLLYFLNRQKTYRLYDGITAISNIILKQKGQVNIEKLASDGNMSLRNFERRFFEQVGISPKLFSRIVRFNEALEIKIKNQKKNWTSIAQDCGYFDQMHFIKEFKLFAGGSPNTFLNQTPPPKENVTYIKGDNTH